MDFLESLWLMFEHTDLLGLINPLLNLLRFWVSLLIEKIAIVYQNICGIFACHDSHDCVMNFRSATDQ